MTAEPQDNKVGRVAIVVADGFEQVELEVPRKVLEGAGFAVDIVSPVSEDTVRGFHHTEKGDEFPVDVKIGKAQPDSYCALLLPGGVHNPDTLRQDAKVLDFVRHFFEVGKPVAAICHGPWTLIEAGVAAGRKLTSWQSIKTDLSNAGAEWVDAAVVVDQGLVTSRGPQDLPAFCKKMIEEFQEGPHPGSQNAAIIAKLGELIKDIKVAMLTTVQPDGTLRSRPMATQGKRFDGTLWFFTSIGSTRAQEVAEPHQVNVGYSDPKANRYVSVSGRAKINQDRRKAAELWTPLLKVWFPKGLDDPDLGLLQVEVERAEYWDTPAGSTTGIVALAKSLLTRRAYQVEETQHQTIELEAARHSAAVPAAAKADAAEAQADSHPDAGAVSEELAETEPLVDLPSATTEPIDVTEKAKAASSGERPAKKSGSKPARNATKRRKK